MQSLRFIRLLLEQDSLYDDYQRVKNVVLEEWLSNKEHQSWRLVPKSKLIRLYNEHGKYGRIHENILLDIWSILHDCVLKVIINSETRYYDDWPFDCEPDLTKPRPVKKVDVNQLEFNLEDPRVELDPEELDQDTVERMRNKAWGRWYLFTSDLSGSTLIRSFGEMKGNARYSDQSRRLYQLLAAAYLSATMTEKFLAIDRLLNFSHGLGNMAKWFVEGGNDTLNRISEFAPQGITAAGLR